MTTTATVQFTFDSSGAVTAVTLVSPTGTIPSDPTGVKADRIANFVDRFGFNLYPNLAGQSPLGASANYTNSNVLAVMQWLVGSSGARPNHRCWYYANQLANFQTWNIDSLIKALGGGWASIAIGMGGSSADVNMQPLVTQSVSGDGWLKRIENVNEPNGSPSQSVPVVLAAADAIKALTTTTGTTHPVRAVLSPIAITMGGPTFANYTLYYDNSTTAAGANTAHAAADADDVSLHNYPPFNGDFLCDTGLPWTQEIWNGGITAYGTHPQYLSEWHSTLYNMQGHIKDPAYDCYYSALFPLQFYRQGLFAWQWWSLFDDYGMAAGLFSTGVGDAKPHAHVMRAAFQLCPDTGSARSSFTPGLLNYTVTGLPPAPSNAPNGGGQHKLFQASSGLFYLYIWNSQLDPGGSSVPVTVTFNAASMTSVNRYVISSNVASGAADPMTVVQQWTNTRSVSFPLAAEVQVLVIKHS